LDQHIGVTQSNSLSRSFRRNVFAPTDPGHVSCSGILKTSSYIGHLRQFIKIISIYISWISKCTLVELSYFYRASACYACTTRYCFNKSVRQSVCHIVELYL